MTASHTTGSGTAETNPLAMIGTITCQDGKADEMAAALAQKVAAAREIGE